MTDENTPAGAPVAEGEVVWEGEVFFASCAAGGPVRVREHGIECLTEDGAGLPEYWRRIPSLDCEVAAHLARRNRELVAALRELAQAVRAESTAVRPRLFNAIAAAERLTEQRS